MADELSPLAPVEGSETDERVAQILSQIIALAGGDLEARGELSDTGDELDAIVGGLNMIAEELGARIHALEEHEQRLTRIASRVSAKVGQGYLDSIVLNLAEELNADYAFIGELTGDENESVQTLALCVDGVIREGITYDLADTPCANVIGQDVCTHTSGVQELFPKDVLLQEMKVEAYAGIPLFGSNQDPLGIIVSLYRSPLVDDANNVRVMQVYSARIAAEMERQHHHDALEASEARYRLISENASDVIWTRDLDLGMRFISPSVTRLRGYAVGEAMAQTLEETMTPASAATMRLALSEGLDHEGDDGVEPHRAQTFEVELLHKDGTTVWSEISASILRGSHGRPIGVLGITRDISERKAMERKTAGLQAELQQAQRLEAIGRLAGGIAHDFNNLLTAILGYSEIVENALALGDPLRTDVGEIRQTAERAATLTSQLLAFSRKQVLDLKLLDLNDCVERSQSMLRRIIGEDIETELALDPELWPVQMDAGQLDQILVNLVVNARDAMPDGGKLIMASRNVTLGEAPDDATLEALPGDYVCLSVKDTGMGMAPETESLIFEPFFSTKPKDVGTGLGLSTVFGIVKQHRGFITVDTAPGQGATIAVLFPRSDKQAELESKGQPRKPHAQGDETILLVEDEEIVRRLTKRMLTQLGYQVIEADSGEAAITEIERHKGEVQLLVTDVIMPGMSGRDLAETLLKSHPRLKVMFMSGYTGNTIARHGVLEPGSHFLQKPFSFGALTKKVRQALDD